MNPIFIPISALWNDEQMQKALNDVKRAQATRVYLAPGDVGRIPFERGEFRTRIMKQYEECSKLFLAEGIETAAWITTLGFGIPMTHYNKKIAESYTRIRSICDRVADDALCPMDPDFSEMTCGILEDLARTGIRMIMLDDELCMSVRPGIGCTCDRHMAEYCRRLGKTVSREDIAHTVFAGKPSRERSVWLDLMGDTMKEFCHRLRDAVDRVDPTVRLGFCAGYTSWDFEGADALELTRILAGNTRPFLRFSGAPYWLAARRFGMQNLQTYIEYARMQNAWCKESGMEIEVFTESDTYPRDRFHTPAAYSECFHLATLASDDLPVLKYMYDYMCAPDFETGYVDAHVRTLPLQQKISEIFAQKKTVGIRVYEPMRRLKDADLGNAFAKGVSPTHADEKKLMQRYAFSSAQMPLTAHAIPTTYEGEGLCGIVFGESARQLPETALRHGLILDIKAAQILQERGVDVGLLDSERLVGGWMELFGGASPDTDLYNTSSIHRVTLRDRAEVLSRYISNEPFSTETFPAAYRYENAKGERFLVYAFDAEEVSDSSSLYWSYGRGKQIADSVEWLGGSPLPARCERHPHLYAICKQSEHQTALAYVNCNIDEIVDAKITLAAPVRAVRFFGCTGEQIDEHTVMISYIKPFGFVAIEVDS